MPKYSNRLYVLSCKKLRWVRRDRQKILLDSSAVSLTPTTCWSRRLLVAAVQVARRTRPGRAPEPRLLHGVEPVALTLVVRTLRLGDLDAGGGVGGQGVALGGHDGGLLCQISAFAGAGVSAIGVAPPSQFPSIVNGQSYHKTKLLSSPGSG